MSRVRIFLSGLYGAESPRMRGGRLWFTDLFARTVMSVGLDGLELRQEARIDDRAQNIGWTPTGELLVLAMDRRRILRQLRDGTFCVHADLAAFAAGPCSGMLVDTAGRAFVGSFGFDLEGELAAIGRDAVARGVRPRSRLACVTPDGVVTVAAADFDVLTNAPVITPDGRTLIVGEMYGRRLLAFDVADCGVLSNRRVWADLGERRPDALALDADGAIWFTHPAGAECVRVAEGGRVLDVIDTGVGCYGCGLGGIDGRSLFPGVADQVPNGEILVAQVGAPRAGWP